MEEGESEGENKKGRRVRGEEREQQEAFWARGDRGRCCWGDEARGELEMWGVTSREESYGPGGRGRGRRRPE